MGLIVCIPLCLIYIFSVLHLSMIGMAHVGPTGKFTQLLTDDFYLRVTQIYLHLQLFNLQWLLTVACIYFHLHFEESTLLILPITKNLVKFFSTACTTKRSKLNGFFFVLALAELHSNIRPIHPHASHI